VVQSIIWSAGPHVQLVFLLKFVHCDRNKEKKRYEEHRP